MSIQALSWVMDHSQSEGTTRCVLFAIANHLDASGEGWAYVNQICSEANCSLNSYLRAMRWAEEHGEIERLRNRGAATKAAANRKPNSFRFCRMGCPKDGVLNLDTPSDWAPQNSQIEHPKDPSRGTQVEHPEPSLSIEPYKEPSKTRASVAVVAPFDTFWQAYPLRKAKGAARRAWDKAIKLAEPAAIIEAAANYAEWQRDSDPRYTAHPATWLNAERWTDDPPLPKEDPTMTMLRAFVERTP